MNTRILTSFSMNKRNHQLVITDNIDDCSINVCTLLQNLTYSPVEQAILSHNWQVERDGQSQATTVNSYSPRHLCSLAPKLQTCFHPSPPFIHLNWDGESHLRGNGNTKLFLPPIRINMTSRTDWRWRCPNLGADLRSTWATNDDRLSSYEPHDALAKWISQYWKHRRYSVKYNQVDWIAWPWIQDPTQEWGANFR